MDKTLTNHLLTCVALYTKALGKSEATVGNKAAGDSRFFRRRRDGEGFTVAKYDAVMAWFEENWPEETPWPKDVPRPSEESAAA